jgi:hypothetical protein
LSAPFFEDPLSLYPFVTHHIHSWLLHSFRNHYCIVLHSPHNKMRSGIALFAMAAASVVDAAAYQLESLNEVPEGWTAAGHPDPSTPMFFRIAMTQPNQGLFEQTLSDISTPGHARYGQHLKRDQLKAMLRPKADATSAVMSWLTDAGVSQETIEDGMYYYEKLHRKLQF